jgi:hypothetical protein
MIKMHNNLPLRKKYKNLNFPIISIKLTKAFVESVIYGIIFYIVNFFFLIKKSFFFKIEDLIFEFVKIIDYLLI